MPMDQNQAPLLEALAKYRQSGAVSFGVPGHKSGKGATDDIKRVIGAQAFKADATTWTNDHSCGA
jgi:arginine decarboxylase